jgi:hypothetical protein
MSTGRLVDASCTTEARPHPDRSPRLDRVVLWAPRAGGEGRLFLAGVVVLAIHLAGVGARATLWHLPDARHTNGLQTHPGAYTERVTAFLEGALTRS